MIETLRVSWAVVAGGVLGTMFFGGLWWTVRRGAASSIPAIWFFASLMVRMSLTLGGFYIVGGADWRRWLLCSAGFLAARLVTMRFLGRPAPLVVRVGARSAP